MLNLAIICVFSSINWESEINYFLKNNPESIYWLPWGSRTLTLTKVCNYLVKNHYWGKFPKISVNSTKYYQYKSNENMPCPLIFFHHNSKSQAGDGLIYYKYEIDKIIISSNAIPIQIDKKRIKHDPVESSSITWIGISKAKRLGSLGYDFAGNFNVHPDFINTKNRENNQVDANKDGQYLYHDVLPVQECFHKETHCSCLICR